MSCFRALTPHAGCSLRMAICGIVLILLVGRLHAAEIRCGGPIADRMVLQRGIPSPIWGWADPHESLTVEFAEQVKATTTDGDGKWFVTLDPLTASDAPRELLVRSGRPDRFKRIADVVVGEVWLASGQSNMHWTFAEGHGVRDNEAELAAASDPLNRQFTVVKRGAVSPSLMPPGSAWRKSNRDNLLEHGVSGDSALCHLFARELRSRLGVPIGVVNASFGGSAIQAWTSEEIQRTVPELSGILAEATRQHATFAERITAYKSAMQDWNEEVEQARLAGRPPPRQPAPPRNPYYKLPGYYFNGMVAPVIPYAIRGVIWYQGEANAQPIEEAALYRLQLPLLIRDWRSHYGRDVPFAWVQLPNYKAGPGWMLVREGMLQSLALPQTGMAVVIDIGEANDIHPKNKQDVAKRLALWALGEVYGLPVGSTSGPTPSSHTVDGRRIVMHFEHADGGLVFDGGMPRGFAIAGADRQWHEANAKIIDDCVIAESENVMEPVALRYGWAANPTCNLRNGHGLPASPFRTDDWPVVE